MYKVTEVIHKTITYYVPVNTEEEVKFHAKHGNLFHACHSTFVQLDDIKIEKVADVPGHVAEFYSPENQEGLHMAFLVNHSSLEQTP